MIDLLSKSFSSRRVRATYFDLRANEMDLESGSDTEMVGINSDKSLSRFFEEVDAIRSQMDIIKELLLKLQAANEESKSVRKAQAMRELRDRMDKDVEDVLKKAKIVKGRLDDLNVANLENRKIFGCEEGTSTDRTRMSVSNGLKRSLKELMAHFQAFRQQMKSEYRETIERRYFAVTGKQADEDTIDNMIETGESETFLQKAIQEQGRGTIIETIKEIQERHDAVKEIEKNLLELHQIFLDMAVLVDAQGEQLNDIEVAVKGASSFVKRGTDQIHIAKKVQSDSRKWSCIAIIFLLIIMIVILVPILVKVLSK